MKTCQKPLRLLIALMIHYEHLLGLLDFAKRVVKAVLVLEHSSMVDGEWAVAVLIHHRYRRFEVELLDALRISNSAYPVLTHGRTALATAPSRDERRPCLRRPHDGAVEPLGDVPSELHDSFKNFIMPCHYVHFSILSFFYRMIVSAIMLVFSDRCRNTPLINPLNPVPHA